MARTRKAPPSAPAGAVKQDRNGRWRYSNGRFAPVGPNGRPVPRGWKRDKLGRWYDREARSRRMRQRMGGRGQGKAPAQTANLGVRLGLVLWKGPPKPLYPTLYARPDQWEAVEPGDQAKALTAWANAHAVPVTKYPRSTWAKHQAFGPYWVTVARHATTWASIVLGYFPGPKVWDLVASTSIANDPEIARELASEALLIESDPVLDRLAKKHGEAPQTRIAVNIPLRPSRK